MGLVTGFAWADLEIVFARATVLLAGALVVAWTLRPAARARHLVWTTTFVLLLALPAAVVWLPSWELAVLPAAHVPVLGTAEAPLSAVGSVVDRTRVEEARPLETRSANSSEDFAGRRDEPGRSGLGSILALIWSLGVLGGLGSLALGSFRFHSLVRTARPTNDVRLLERAKVQQTRLGVRRDVRLLIADAVTTPMAGGIRNPVIVLPRGAAQWPDDRVDVVLTHEMIHVRRHDALRHFVGCVALAVYWFHPLSWLASRMAMASREQACDQEVVSLGTRPSDYARHLLELANALSPAPAMASLPMVQQSQLEKRVMSILAPSQPSQNAVVTGLTFLAFCAFGVTAAFAIPVALQGPAEGLGQDVAAAPLVTSPPVAAPAVRAVPTVGAVSPVPPIVATAPRAPQAAAREADPTCRGEGLSGAFSGSISTEGDRVETSGWHNGDRMIQRYIEGVRLCFRIHGQVVMNDADTEVRAVGRDSWVVLESERNGMQRLVISEGPSGIEYDWTVDGDSRPFDAQAREWHDHMFSVLFAYWEASRIRGEQSSLRGQISSMRGHVSSLRGRISSHRGHVSSLRGRISSTRGRVSSMKGRISSQRGRVSSLKGQISSLRAERSSLRSAARATSDSETQARLEREMEVFDARIANIEQEIEDYGLEERTGEVEEELARYDSDARVQEIEREIEAYNLESKVRELEEEIAEYGLESRIEAKEREIVALDAERRAEALEAAAAPRVEALRRLIGRF